MYNNLPLHTPIGSASIYIENNMNTSLKPLPELDEKNESRKPSFLKISKSSIPVIEKIILIIILALAVYFFLPKISSLEKTANVLRSLKAWAVLLAVGAQVLRAYGNGLTIQECVKITKQDFPIVRAALIFMASYSFGLVGGGMFGSAATTYRWTRVSGGNTEGASLAASIPAFFLSFVLSAVSVFGLIFLFLSNNLSTLQVIAYVLIALGLTAVGILLVIAMRYQQKSLAISLSIVRAVFKFLKKDFDEEKVSRQLSSMFLAWNFLVQEGWKGPMIGSMVSTFGDILTIFFLFIACGSPQSPLVVITGYGLPNLFGRMAFIIPGGVGVIESTMVALYTSLGVENSIATVITLTYRLLSFWAPALSGFLLLPYFNRLTSKSYEELP